MIRELVLYFFTLQCFIQLQAGAMESGEEDMPDMSVLTSKCQSLAPVKKNRTTVKFQMPGYCYSFTCDVTVLPSGKEMTIDAKGCVGTVQARPPCYIRNTDSSLNYPNCCPKTVCPGDKDYFTKRRSFAQQRTKYSNGFDKMASFSYEKDTSVFSNKLGSAHLKDRGASSGGIGQNYYDDVDNISPTNTWSVSKKNSQNFDQYSHNDHPELPIQDNSRVNPFSLRIMPEEIAPNLKENKPISPPGYKFLKVRPVTESNPSLSTKDPATEFNPFQVRQSGVPGFPPGRRGETLPSTLWRIVDKRNATSGEANVKGKAYLTRECLNMDTEKDDLMLFTVDGFCVLYKCYFIEHPVRGRQVQVQTVPCKGTEPGSLCMAVTAYDLQKKFPDCCPTMECLQSEDSGLPAWKFN